MFRNYLVTALRALGRNRWFSAINIAGLSLGMAACVMILLYVQDELSYDKHHPKADRIIRLSREWIDDKGNSSLHLGHLAPPFAPALAEAFPDDIEAAVRVNNFGGALVSAGEKHLLENRFFFADSQFFDVFSGFTAVLGTLENVLNRPDGVVVSKSAAARLFGTENPIGKTILVNNQYSFMVLGVMTDAPVNTHFHPEIVAGFLALETIVGKDRLAKNLGSNNYATYLLLREGADREVLKAKFPAFIDALFLRLFSAETVQKYFGTTPPGKTNLLHVWDIRDIHLQSQLASELETNGSMETVQIFAAVAVFILLIGCFNFINLTTAKAFRRAREVGMRKVSGAGKRDIMLQFLGESGVITFFSMLLAVVLVWAGLPLLNVLFGKTYALNVESIGTVSLLFLAVGFFTALFAGSYPAFFLSRFEPTQIFRPEHKLANRVFFRSVLVILQFTAAIVLMISVWVVRDQLAYMQNKPLGFDQQGLLAVGINPGLRARFQEILDRVQAIPGVTAVSAGSRIPSGSLLDSQDTKFEKDGKMVDSEVRISDVLVEFDYFKTIKATVLVGRDFDKTRVTDSTEAFMLNEKALAATGRTLETFGDGFEMELGGTRGRVIGVVQDFHFENLKQEIIPVIFAVNPRRFNQVLVRYDVGQKDSVLAALTRIWTFLIPNRPVNFRFIEDSYVQQYEAEARLETMFSYFSLLAVFIGSIGLLGLAMFVTEQRTREIGIRKLLGAESGGIVWLVSKDFLVLVSISLALSAPLSWVLMRPWLESFAYATAFSWMNVGLAGILALGVAAFTVGSQTWRATGVNPARTLRS